MFKLQKDEKSLKANGDLSGRGEYAEFGRIKGKKWDKKRKVYYFDEDIYHQDDVQTPDDD